MKIEGSAKNIKERRRETNEDREKWKRNQRERIRDRNGNTRN